MNKKMDLSGLFTTKLNMISFIVESALTFRLNMDSILELFDMCEIFNVNSNEEVKDNLLKKYGYMYESINYVLFLERYDQDIAKENFKKYYDKLMITRNTKLYREYIGVITDEDAKKILNKEYLELTDEEFKEVIIYQLKYAFSDLYMSKDLNISHTAYNNRARKVTSMYPDIQERYNELSEYYKDIYTYTNRGKA